MNFVVLEEPNEKRDEFVSARSGLLFHTSLWCRVIQEGYGCPMRYLVLEDRGRWLCALPGMIVGNRFFRIFYSLVPYGGFIGKRDHIPEFLNLLHNWARQERIGRIQIVDPEIKNPQELPDFKCVESYRHILELRGKSDDQIWRGYRESLRRNIKAATKSDLSFEKIRSREEVDQLYDLYLDSMKRNRALVKYPLRLFRRMFDLLVPAFSDMFFVKHRGRPIAGMVAIYSKDVAHYFHGGSAAEYLHLRPNDFLFHRAIQVAKEKGKSYFDFFGSDKKLVSLIRFKDKWGTRREELLSFHKDFGLLRPILFRAGLRLAQTSVGSALHRRIKSLGRGNSA